MDYSQNPQWQELEKKAKGYQEFSIKEHIQTADSKVFTKVNNGVYFDFSKTFLDEAGLNSLINYADSIGLKKEIQQFFKGEYKNESENTSVLHPAIRGSIKNLECNKEIDEQKQKMNKLAENLNNMKMRGFSGRAIKHLVHIGIGGSEFGVKTLFHALQEKNSKIQIHFISSLDGLELERLLSKYPIDQMIFIIVSKSFRTEDTLNNAKLAQEKLLTLANKTNSKKREKNIIKHHFIGVSNNEKAMSEFGISKDYQLKIWEWLSGRFSSFSAVSFALLVNIGSERFEKLLQGACALDSHFEDESLSNNIPVVLALIHFWHFSFLKLNHLAIFPYDALLQELPMHLQQLFMESLGKKTNRKGQKISYKTCPIVLGDLGTRSQHAFYQLLYQGKPKLLAHFLLTKKSQNNNPEFHLRSQLHALVQSYGLVMGKKSKQSNQHYPGNLPIIQIAIPEVNDFYLGYLFALYEQIIFCWSVLLDLNGFDQWGVEYGKDLAKKAKIENKKIDRQEFMDVFSNSLIDWFNQPNKK